MQFAVAASNECLSSAYLRLLQDNEMQFAVAADTQGAAAALMRAAGVHEVPHAFLLDTQASAVAGRLPDVLFAPKSSALGERLHCSLKRHNCAAPPIRLVLPRLLSPCRA